MRSQQTPGCRGGGGYRVGVWSASPDAEFWSLHKQLFILSPRKSRLKLYLSTPPLLPSL